MVVVVVKEVAVAIPYLLMLKYLSCLHCHRSSEAPSVQL